jgi:membrane protease YdiL (CAAX protease family)
MKPVTSSRWPEGSNARVVHALVLWAAFVALCHVFRLLLYPSLGALAFPVGALLYFGGVLGLGMARLGRVRARDLGLTLVGWPREVLIGLVAVAVISAGLLVWNGVMHGPDEVRALVEQITTYSLSQRVALFGVGLMAASAEDTLFRGYLQPALMARYGAWAGVIATMALFQVHHYIDWPTATRIGCLVIVGLGFGIPRWRNRPLVASYVAHVGLWTLWGHA